MSKKGVLIPFDLLDELTDYFQQRADVKDGSDGPRPNREMLLQGRLESEVTRPEDVAIKEACEIMQKIKDNVRYCDLAWDGTNLLIDRFLERHLPQHGESK